VSPDKSRWFVVLFEDGEPVRVYKWDQWVAIPVPDRTFEASLFDAQDELDAFNQALRSNPYE
jgi:hypothetical protein